MLKSHETPEVDVTVPQTFTLAAYSEMEVQYQPVNCRGDWMVKDKSLKKPQVFVARAVVVPQNGYIPMRLLDLQPYPVIVYKRTKVATAEEVILCNDVSAVNHVESLKCSEKEWEEVLGCVLEKMPDYLTDQELKQFSALLTSYAHLIAVKPNDLGRINMLTHQMEITRKPVRQAVRKIPIPQRQEVKKLLSEMRQKEIIAPCKSPRAS